MRNRENEPDQQEIEQERNPELSALMRERGDRPRLTAYERKVPLDLDLVERAWQWWERECANEVKSRCSIWVILAMFAQWERESRC